jgi:predicted transcriptional regulator YdeE
MTTINGFKIIGISVRTTNQNNQSAQDIGKLWGQFHSDQLFDKIPNKFNNDIYSIYTDYKSNFTEEYTTIIGLRVNSLDTIPEGLIGREFPADNFVKFIAKGQMPKAIIDTWANIWERDIELNRKYSYDFELYGDKCQNGENSEVEIYIATKS